MAARTLAQNRLGCVDARVKTVFRQTSHRKPSTSRQQRQVAVHAADDRIDTATGSPIRPSDVTAPNAGFQLTTGNNLTWRYRKIAPAEGRGNPNNPPVLLLHGIGSSSYTWRSMMLVLSAMGYEAIAPDWIGFGDSDKPAPGVGFGYTADEYVKGMKDFVAAAGIRTPFVVVVQGYVLGQYGLLYALEQEGLVERLLILNTPLATGSKLRPELAAYKSPLPFLRPGNKPFAADIYMATGSPFDFQYSDAMVFRNPYDTDPAANAALAATMEALDWDGLLRRVDSGYRTWKKPSLLMFGSADPFIKLGDVYKFLDNMRTCMRLQPLDVKLGHNPQEDDVIALASDIAKFLNGNLDNWVPTTELLKSSALFGGKDRRTATK